MPDAATVRLLACVCAVALAPRVAGADDRVLWFREAGATRAAPEGAITPAPSADGGARHVDAARAALARAREQFLAYAFREASTTLRVAAAEQVEHVARVDRGLALELLHWAGACTLLASDRDGARDAFRRALAIEPSTHVPASVFPPEVAEFFEETRRAMVLEGSSARTVRTVPSGARVEVDGRDEGASPVTLRLAPGAHTLRLERVGYRVWSGPLQAEGPVAQDLEVVLAESTGAELRAQVGAVSGVTGVPDAPTLARVVREFSVDRVVVALRDGTELTYPPRRPGLWPWIAAGAGVAAVGAGVGLFFLLRPPPTVTLIAP